MFIVMKKQKQKNPVFFAFTLTDVSDYDLINKLNCKKRD